MYDYFDDEIDDQPDLTLNENEQSYRGTPATEYPPTNFSAILNSSNQHGKTVKKGYTKVYLKIFSCRRSQGSSRNHFYSCPKLLPIGASNYGFLMAPYVPSRFLSVT